MTEKLTALQKSIRQATAALNGDGSQVTTHEVSIMPAPQYSATEIKAIRAEIEVTQRVLATVLSVSPRTVESWESGKSRPSRSASRLLEIIKKQPEVLTLIRG
ncbi:transcriptional regulator [Lactobacillus sp. CBA3606]|uniref:helix-turn-helix domain-containing protein n=1 Tax=Lactobacillus sp. CBA3606 TaxID=2099789 RepID=UPI000CFE1A84|nr:type II toxin-antitoxin system MqsA family antitoxin [Lactobacillus sp. CBA3606]AVK63955.1 transcriptional regulator [Lactobacillus sp. CBA3606]